MGLRGPLPTDLTVSATWDTPGRLEIDARVPSSPSVIATLAVGLDDEGEWCIQDVWTTPSLQRRGIARHLLDTAYREIRAAGHDLEQIEHNERLKPDGLAWAMGVEDEGYHTRWASANLDRVHERFDEEGMIAAEHDRHLQEMLQSADPAHADTIARRLAYCAPLPKVAVPATDLYVADQQLPGDEPLAVRSSAGEYEDLGHLWVLVAGAGSVDMQGSAVPVKVTSLEALGLDEMPSADRSVSQMAREARPDLSGLRSSAPPAARPVDQSGPDVSPSARR